jgi:hypothetical protein
MVMLLPSQSGSPRTIVRIEPSTSPPRVETSDGRALFPDWDRARDDAGRLRRCVLCGQEQLFRRRRLPQVTGLIVVLAFTLALLSLLGYASGPFILVVMGVVLIVDLGVLFFSPESLECYGCHVEYRDLDIGAWHRPWSRTLARRLSDERTTDGDGAFAPTDEENSPTESTPQDRSSG